MKNKRFRRYWLLACVGVALASCYPLIMGVRVVVDMIAEGTVLQENYPKYIIRTRRYALRCSAAFSACPCGCDG